MFDKLERLTMIPCSSPCSLLGLVLLISACKAGETIQNRLEIKTIINRDKALGAKATQKKVIAFPVIPNKTVFHSPNIGVITRVKNPCAIEARIPTKANDKPVSLIFQ